MGRTWTEFGPFYLGAWFKPLAAIAVSGVLVLAYVGIQPPNDIIINYAIGVLVLMAICWFGIERRRFKGPPVWAALLDRQAILRQNGRAVRETA